MFINNLYNIGDPVYLKTDLDQNRRIITEILIQPNDLIMYLVSFGTENSKHYDFELSKEKCLV